MMEKLTIVAGLVIIVCSFIYVLRSKNALLENLLKKSKEEYEKREAIKEKAFQVVDGQVDAFDALKDGVTDTASKLKPNKDNSADDNKTIEE